MARESHDSVSSWAEDVKTPAAALLIFTGLLLLKVEPLTWLGTALLVTVLACEVVAIALAIWQPQLSWGPFSAPRLFAIGFTAIAIYCLLLLVYL